MRDILDRIHWPQALLLIATLVSLVAFPILFLTLVPERVVDKVFGLPWMTIITLGIPALIIALAPVLHAFMRPVVAKAEPDSKAPSSPPRSSRTSGFVDVHLLAELALGSLLALAGALLLHGCGSAIRTHAVTAHTWHVALELADTAILETTRSELAACPHDDGALRMECTDRIERLATAAAAARDVLVAPANAYRAATLGACGVDVALPDPTIPEDCPDPGPDAMALLARFLASLVHDAPVLLAAMRALGAPIPEGL